MTDTSPPVGRYTGTGVAARSCVLSCTAESGCPAVALSVVLLRYFRWLSQSYGLRTSSVLHKTLERNPSRLFVGLCVDTTAHGAE
ncbi:MAG: hypothetical protein IJQ44_08250 [Bacteroidaceae bacterium]|nr:hypothetical protein [Bacteroidaceae bacterium]